MIGREYKGDNNMVTAAENARKVLNSIMTKLNLDALPRGTFIEKFGTDLAYIRYNGCIKDRFSSGELSDVEVDERLGYKRMYSQRTLKTLLDAYKKDINDLKNLKNCL